VLWYNLIQNGLEQGAYIYKRPGFYVYTLRLAYTIRILTYEYFCLRHNSSPFIFDYIRQRI
jgi:hypothetical protein